MKIGDAKNPEIFDDFWQFLTKFWQNCAKPSRTPVFFRARKFRKIFFRNRHFVIFLSEGENQVVRTCFSEKITLFDKSKNDTKNIEKHVLNYYFWPSIFRILSKKFPEKHPPKHPPQNAVFVRVFRNLSPSFLSFFGIFENTPPKLGKHVPNVMFCRFFWGGSKFRENFVKIFVKIFWQFLTNSEKFDKSRKNLDKIVQNGDIVYKHL